MSLLKIIRVFALIMSLFCVSATASANPGRFTLWLHGQHDLSDRYSLKSDLAIAGLQAARPTTYVYVGTGINATKWLGIDLFGGYRSDDVGILSPRAFLHFDKISTFTFVEVYTNKDNYWFQTADYATTKWLKTGVEYEAFGSYAHLTDMSHGVGPHLIFCFGRYTLDSILQARRSGSGHWGAEPQFRIHGSF